MSRKTRVTGDRLQPDLVPLAGGVLAPIGVNLPMEVGAVLMSISTIVVAANAQWLRRLDLRPGRTT